jgi:hypothetical protein
MRPSACHLLHLPGRMEQRWAAAGVLLSERACAFVCVCAWGGGTVMWGLPEQGFWERRTRVAGAGRVLGTQATPSVPTPAGLMLPMQAHCVVLHLPAKLCMSRAAQRAEHEGGLMGNKAYPAGAWGCLMGEGKVAAVQHTSCAVFSSNRTFLDSNKWSLSLEFPIRQDATVPLLDTRCACCYVCSQ